jgi:hypothetical protein
MMKEIDIYVHSHEGVEPKLVKASEDATVNELLEKIVAAAGRKPAPDEKVLLFLEDIEEPLEHHRKLCECEIRHRHHVHWHHCHRIKVSVFYNGEHHELFPPSATVKRVLKWAIKAFKLTPAEAADKILVLKENPKEELPLDAHIGSFAKPHQCSVDLCLTAPVEVQG